MVVEIVLRMMRWQPDQEPAPVPEVGVLFYISTPNAAAKKKAVMPIARHLAVDLWTIFTGRTNAVTFVPI